MFFRNLPTAVDNLRKTGYYTGKGFGSYWAGVGVSAVAGHIGGLIGTSIAGPLGPIAGVVAGVIIGTAGAVLIYFAGELLDWIYGGIKSAIFEE